MPRWTRPWQRPRRLGLSSKAPGVIVGIWIPADGSCSASYLPDKKAVIVVMVKTDIPVGKANPAPTIMKALAQVVTRPNVPQ